MCNGHCPHDFPTIRYFFARARNQWDDGALKHRRHRLLQFNDWSPCNRHVQNEFISSACPQHSFSHLHPSFDIVHQPPRRAPPIGHCHSSTHALVWPSPTLIYCRLARTGPKLHFCALTATIRARASYAQCIKDLCRPVHFGSTMVDLRIGHWHHELSS
jgi:hypothetical protein